MFFRRQLQPNKANPAARLSVEALNDRIVPALLSVGDAVVYEPIPAGTTQYAEVRVSLDAPAKKTVEVNYSTADGTARAGSDYTPVSGQLIFAPGQTSQSVLVPVRGDDEAEGRETFFVNLSGARGARIADGQGAVTIVDDVLRIAINNVSLYEGNSGYTLFTFTVSLSSPCDKEVTVNYATADGPYTDGPYATGAKAGEDYLATSGTLTFAPGETTKTIEVYVIGDWSAENDEQFFVNLSGASSNVVVADAQGVGWIMSEETWGGGE